MRNKDGSLANVVNLENAPKFQKLIDLGRDVLQYQNGQITFGSELPPVTTEPKPMGVKPRRGRQKNKEASSAKGQLGSSSENPSQESEDRESDQTTKVKSDLRGENSIYNH